MPLDLGHDPPRLVGLKIIVLDMDSSESLTTSSRKQRLQRPFRLYLLSPVVRVQPTGDVRALRLTVRQRAQCRWLARHAGARSRPLSGSGSVYFRGDAAFANPEIDELLEAERMSYAIRLPANRVLQDRIGYLLRRPARRPPHEVRHFFASFGYQAQSICQTATA
jgi:hypothetical protein